MKPRPTDAEFDELKRVRDEHMLAIFKAVCEKEGWDPDTAGFHHSNGPCYCACPDGPCQHIWNGPEYTEGGGEGEGFMSSVTCSRCGTPAIYHDIRCGP